ncbi:MAG: DegT/DnrJ/EryC1/StrS family aminotransferase [Anaerolineae bacterium]|nr:DegT/DnrJ/EryC1/StrS family aminotransferase [Anaerolineae bacterium]
MSELAILGGAKTCKDDYPKWPVHDERDIEAVTRVIKSGQWGGYPYPGKETKRFIDSFLAMQGGNYGVLMMNGTVTMEVALRAAGIGWGDEVLVPAYTFQATAAAPMAAGAIPVIVDVDPNSYCLDPKAAEAAITDKTRAIIPVHLGAQMTDMDAIMELAEKYNLIVIEDCAHAHGAKWRGQGAGTIGHFGSFSMQSSKIMTAGEGGLLICKSEEMALQATSIIDCGRPHDAKGEMMTMGANYRVSELQAALLNVAIERFPAQAKQREAMAAYMDEALSEVSGVRVLPRDERHTTRSIYRYIFAVDPQEFGAENDVICAALHMEGIPCWEGYEPMNNYELFQPKLSKLPVPSAFPEHFKFDEMRLPVSERACEYEAVWLDENIFRAGSEGVDDAVAALAKIQATLSSDSGAVADIKRLLSSKTVE